MNRLGLATGCVIALVAGGVKAETVPDEINLGRMTAGYSYFNRSGADFARHDADAAECIAAALHLKSYHHTTGSTPGLLGALIEGAQQSSADRGVFSAGLENCMIVHGWRVVRLDEAEGKALANLPATELRQRLSPWIGADAPHGTIGRTWNNDAARAEINHFSLHASHTKDGHLSILAATPKDQSQPAVAMPERHTEAKPTKVKLDPKWPKGAVPPTALEAIPSGASVIIANVRGLSLRQGNGFVFSRIGPDRDTPPSTIDLAPDQIIHAIGTLGASSKVNLRAFVVPAGRWRISAMVGGILGLNLCLGSPAFEVKSGEVVYTGLLDLKQPHMRPDFDLAPVREWLGTAPVAQKVRPAEYVNGVGGSCGSSSIYALEFDGFPFEPGYVLGSQVPPIASGK